jgi:splicing factor 3B subunit 2
VVYFSLLLSNAAVVFLPHLLHATDYIADTGIAKIRESVLESEAMKKSKQKARDKMTPKMGKIDIDYQVLHDAFFKYQTKPPMSRHGDMYYEGKEFEVDHKEKKPGVFSSALREALGLQEDGSTPPPWLINMQRYGPPPAYPSLRIPGLSAPIPEGASYGYHPGGWGKPPVDEYNRPLYGDVFGTYVDTSGTEYAAVDRAHWGELEEVSSDEEEEESAGEEEDEEEGDEQYARGPGDMSGTETPMTLDGISSVASGLETPDTINLRKRTGFETPQGGAGGGPAPELYHVAKEQAPSKEQQKGQLYGSEKTYVLPGSVRGVEVTMNPDELESELGDLKGGQEALRDAYESQLAADRGGEEGGARDFEAADVNDPRNKRKRRAESSAVSSRHKNFKF